MGVESNLAQKMTTKRAKVNLSVRSDEVKMCICIVFDMVFWQV